MEEEPRFFCVTSPSEGERVACSHPIDPLRVAATPFLDLVKRLDELANGPAGRILPRWAFFDCAELPGGVAGLALPAAALPARARELMQVRRNYDGPVPLAQVALVPMAETDAWHVYAMAALHWVEPALAPVGLCARSVEWGLDAFGVATAYAAAPWESPDLAVLAGLAPLELLTAWTPAHSQPATMTCRFTMPSGLTGETGNPTAWVAAHDEQAQRRLQSELENGRHYEIVGPPEASGVPLRAGPAPGART